MGDWKKKKLGKLGSTYNGLSGKTKEDFGLGKPYISYLNIFDNTQVKNYDFDYVRVNKNENQNKVQKGDILFTTSSETKEEVGMTSVVTFTHEELYLNSFCFGFRLDEPEKFDPYFLSYLLRSHENRKQIIFNGQGSTRINLSKTQLLKNVSICYPENIDEQTNIASILKEVDSAISKTIELIEKHKVIQTGLLQDLLTKGIDKEGNIRSEETHEFKDSPLGSIPKDWNIVRLNDLINKGTTISYGIVQTGAHVPDGIRVLRTVDLNSDSIDSANLLRTKKEISERYAKTILKEGDIVCNVRASVGDFNIIDKNLEDVNTTRGVARISPDKNKIYNRYLLWTLRSHQNMHQIELLIKGTTFIDINIGDLKKIFVRVPNQESEQIQIANSIDFINTQINEEIVELEKLKKLKTGLMKDLLSGEVKSCQSY